MSITNTGGIVTNGNEKTKDTDDGPKGLTSETAATKHSNHGKDDEGVPQSKRVSDSTIKKLKSKSASHMKQIPSASSNISQVQVRIVILYRI